MPLNKQPETSIAAGKEASNEMKQIHYVKILGALCFIGEGNYEVIANHAGLEKHAVGRRVNELRELGRITTLTTKTVTSTGRMAFVHRLTINN